MIDSSGGATRSCRASAGACPSEGRGLLAARRQGVDGPAHAGHDVVRAKPLRSAILAASVALRGPRCFSVLNPCLLADHAKPQTEAAPTPTRQQTSQRPPSNPRSGFASVA